MTSIKAKITTCPNLRKKQTKLNTDSSCNTLSLVCNSSIFFFPFYIFNKYTYYEIEHQEKKLKKLYLQNLVKIILFVCAFQTSIPISYILNYMPDFLKSGQRKKMKT